MVKNTVVLGSILLLTACNGSDSGDTATNSTITLSLVPSEAVVVSPFDVTQDDANPKSTTQMLKRVSAVSTKASPTYSWATARIDAILNGSTPLRNTFTANLFYRQGTNAACYGPNLLYQDHPDGAGGSGELPGGDLLMWLEEDTTGHACAAAQMNSRLAGTRDQSMGALMVIASMVATANANSIALPAAGASITLTSEMNALSVLNVTFNSVTLSQTSTNEWSYEVDLTYTRSGVADNIIIGLEHTSSGTRNQYSGVLFYRVDGDQSDFPGGNCTSSDRTLNGSLRYDRNSLTDMSIQSRTGIFCGSGVNGLTSGAGDDTDNMVDASLYYDAGSAPNGWSENFNIFVANFDPSQLSGQYAYVWQAGAGDSHSRVFNVGINAHSPLDGESYAGYGERVGSSVGEVQGLICNWAGPGNSHSLQELAQRQFITQDPTTGLFDASIGAGSADITYAPTNSCDYGGSGSFIYDVDADGDLSDETHAAVTSDLMQPVDTDLDGTATIEEKIASRGYTLPIAPGNWPGQ
ncbi:hypothetical protein [Photobacterium alginatilyticum]|uniref:Lipoprotein n=1 Tax=Photobacterium alginatilyticum TaxID=1775171 RepID=A0ABW9YHI0_9GAMM|nr:hypothetical protein [Photobacterium alginatilyticum]NBI53213.1 hypothetical protein [Photobacterium alginatilyticum]